MSGCDGSAAPVALQDERCNTAFTTAHQEGIQMLSQTSIKNLSFSPCEMCASLGGNLRPAFFALIDRPDVLRIIGDSPR